MTAAFVHCDLEAGYDPYVQLNGYLETGDASFITRNENPRPTNCNRAGARPHPALCERKDRYGINEKAPLRESRWYFLGAVSSNIFGGLL